MTDEWEELEKLLLTLKKYTEDTNMGMSSFGVGDTAMVIGSIFGDVTRIQGIHGQESSLRLFNVDWDVVSFPLFNGNLPAEQMLVIGIPTKSENKEDALKVLRYLLSKEVQTYNVQRGFASLRADAESIQEEFGAETDLLAGKSISSFFTTSHRGSFDLSFEYYGMDLRLNGIMRDDSIFSPDEMLQREKDLIQTEISAYYDKRNRFVEEMKSKF